MKIKLKQLISVIGIIAILTLLGASSTKAATLFQDNFDSGNADNWIVIGDSGWHVQNGEYGIHLEPGLSNSIPDNNHWDFNWQSISYQVDLRGVDGTDKNILVKFVDPQNFIEVHHTGGNIYLQKYSTNGGAGILDVENYPLNNGVTYHFKIDINQADIKVYINNSLILQGTEQLPLLQNWKIGLREGTGSVSPTEVWYDNVSVTDLPSSTPTPSSLNVPNIKQFTSPWGTQTYDQANVWSPNDKTIKSWGCALTSADMILQYYGFAINPGDLNTWLINQPDGFIPNGQLNWLAVSRYTKQNSNGNLPSLEYKRISPTNQNLTNEINSSRPAILQEPGHFIVAKSISDQTFGINDPAYVNHPTLASYNNSFESLGTYTPSHTDLSYIMLTIDPSFDIKVFDSSNQEIVGDTFVQDPLINDSDNSSTSGNGIKYFMFPKPSSGNYNVQISGNGTYELDSYLYDVDGNVNLTKTNGITGNNQTDNFEISIGSQNSTSQNTTIEKILEDWDDAKNQNKISKQSVYLEVKLALNVAKDLINHHNNKLAKLSLVASDLLIKNYTPKYIDQKTSQIIDQEIKLLINSL